jgi:hypothetical protein
MLIAERIDDERFKELTLCGRNLGESDKDREAQEEVRRRLNDGLGATMDRYIAEKVQPFRSQLVGLLQSVGTDVLMRDVAKHVRQKRQAFHDLWTHSVNDAMTFWDGEIEGILSAECKLEQTTTGSATFYGFSLITNAGIHLRHFWDGTKNKDKARAAVESKPPMHLHKYPNYIKKLVTQHLEELENTKATLTEKLSALEAKLFDVEQLFLQISPDQSCARATLAFDYNVAANAVVGLLMTQGPTSDSIPGFERSIRVGDEMETCEKDRADCQETIAKLEKAAAEISELFPVRHAPLSSSFLFILSHR